MRVAFVMQSTQVRCSIEHVLEIYWCVRMKTWSNIVYVNGLSNVDRIVFDRLFFLIDTSKRTFFSFEAKQFIFSELKWLKNCLTRDTVFVCFSSCFLKTTKCTTECWEERKMQKYKNNWFQIDWNAAIHWIQKLVYETERKICEKTPYCPFNIAAQTD